TSRSHCAGEECWRGCLSARRRPLNWRDPLDGDRPRAAAWAAQPAPLRRQRKVATIAGDEGVQVQIDYLWTRLGTLQRPKVAPADQPRAPSRPLGIPRHGPEPERRLGRTRLAAAAIPNRRQVAGRDARS